MYNCNKLYSHQVAVVRDIVSQTYTKFPDVSTMLRIVYKRTVPGYTELNMDRNTQSVLLMQTVS